MTNTGLNAEGFHVAADRVLRGGEWRVTNRLGRWFVSESKPREACEDAEPAQGTV